MEGPTSVVQKEGRGSLRLRLASILGGIRGRMIVLLMVAGIPVASIAIGNSVQDYKGALEDGRREVETLRTLVASRYGVALGISESVLATLARQDPRLSAEGRCTTAFSQTIELHSNEISHLAVIRPGQPPLCGTLPAGVDAEALAREAILGRRTVYGAFLPATAGRPAGLPIALPAGGETGDWAIIGVLLLRDYAALPGEGSIPDHLVWLIDRTDHIVSPGRADGRPTPVLDSAVLARIEEGGPGIEGRGGAIAFAGARLNSGLSLVVGRPVAAVREAARAILLQRIMELATFLIACLAAIVVGADLAMVRPLRLLSARVRGWRPGNPFRVSPAGTEPREVRAVEQAFSEAAAALTRREADLRAALEQRDALMGEIHHRVKNNLQIVSSLLNLQAGRIADPAAAEEFLAARNRVRALATLHRHLYMQHSFEAVSLQPFLTELANQQFASHNEAPGERLALKLDVADIAISTDQAVSLSLFVTEAVGNAVEHAFPDEARGTVWASISAEGEEVTLLVRDDGIGLPDRKTRPRGLGLQLMEGFAKQLGGTLVGGRVEGEPGGTSWTVRFPVRENPAPRPLGR
ncbi:sensor histidine kinase [Muricoccus pecuniae]|uniref:histidine kinase n=1 Tax=Muricoccus pecuniae TaxID=693023 RepID=A0A840YII9_9PROT|nr:sensor histidine kinase [Roseomonas pecuniae]MBB5693744.1 two-component sensor histidine kinase [Roseomonas pecuniae]